MTYTPMSHQLVSHEEVVALEFEERINDYLVCQWWAEWETNIRLPDDQSVFRREYMGQFTEDLNSVYGKILLGEEMLHAERRHPIKPMRIETSEISHRYFEEYFKVRGTNVR